MFGLQTLDVILGLIFVYLLLSLVCTAVAEVIAQWLNWRAETLAQGIRLLLTGKSEKTTPDVATAQQAEKEALKDLGAVKEKAQAGAPGEFAAYQEAATDLRARERAAADAQTAAREAQRASEQAQVALLTAQGHPPDVVEAARAAYDHARQKAAAAADAARLAEEQLVEARQAEAVAATGLDAKVPGMAEQLRTARATLEQAQATLKVSELYAHPLIWGLSQARRKPIRFLQSNHLPSYIPARTFSTALLDVVAPSGPGGSTTIADLRSAALKLPEQIGKPLLIFINDAGNDLERFQTSLGRWYEDAMERVSGLYKRKAQAAILLIALVVTVATNADSIRIGQALSSSAALRAALVAQAEALANDPSAEQRTLLQRRQEQDAALPADSAAAQEGEPPEIAASRMGEIRAMIDSLQTLGIPLGWELPAETRQRMDEAPWYGQPFVGAWFYGMEVLRNLPGLLVTMLALSLGAPFWFDVLNKVIHIRTAGRAPEERPKPPEALPPPRGA